MNERLRWLAATILFFWAVSSLAGDIGPTSITFSPASPKPGEAVTATISGTWSSGCPPQSATVSMSGRSILIEAKVGCVACPAVIRDYSFGVSFLAPAVPGVYSVEYRSTDCDRTTVAATQRLSVAQSCDFGQALSVDRESVRVGETVALSWCDPSYTIGTDNAYAVNGYRVFRARSARGPFTVIADVKPAGSTHFGVTADMAGTDFFYVEAHGCMITIAGSTCARDGETVLVSNIVSVASAAANACLPAPTTLCLAGGRFQVTAQWETSDRRNGDGRAVPLTGDSGYFWFFDAQNVEVTVKMLNACALPQPAFWFFASGMTNVGVELLVTDLKTLSSKRYTNANGSAFTPILDTNAFGCR